ncbi:cupin domain-containing protein [Niabella beijingensis]|uniref:cupin domain-containing protein n=1 Tax=Niabella beijingensis TaxID=2872700 RepID=UPI001CBAA459|nr:hypothetical protein [Niabella beijingensis]MBZ4190471.1 hypothetical protein [Niabella beijingensis]
MLRKNKQNEWIPWELRRTNPDIFYFREDQQIPNSPFPLLVYRGFFDKDYAACESWLQKKFTANKWFPLPAFKIFDDTHYYSNTHIALGVCAGEAQLQLGGTLGITTTVEKGDVVILPAGVALRLIGSGSSFSMVAASSVKVPLEMHREQNGQAAGSALHNIIPDTDPILGRKEGLQDIWQPVDTYSR